MCHLRSGTLKHTTTETEHDHLGVSRHIVTHPFSAQPEVI